MRSLRLWLVCASVLAACAACASGPAPPAATAGAPAVVAPAAGPAQAQAQAQAEEPTAASSRNATFREILESSRAIYWRRRTPSGVECERWDLRPDDATVQGAVVLEDVSPDRIRYALHYVGDPPRLTSPEFAVGEESTAVKCNGEGSAEWFSTKAACEGRDAASPIRATGCTEALAPAVRLGIRDLVTKKKTAK